MTVGESSFDWEEFSGFVKSFLVQLVQVNLLVARLRDRLIDVSHLEI